MSSASTLASLENLLESFLERAVARKQDRLTVLGGLSDLDDMARDVSESGTVADHLSNWFAEHNRLLDQDRLRPGDLARIGEILGELREKMESAPPDAAAVAKVRTEIDRWQEAGRNAGAKLVLKRGPEARQEPPEDSIALLDKELKRVALLFESFAEGKKHVLSLLDDSLSRAREQKSKDALLLSAFIIYSLKQRRYKVEPFVRKLREVEKFFRETEARA